MPLDADILKLLQADGYRSNEAIRDALAEFVDIVQDENETMEEEGLEDEDLEVDEVEDD